MTDHADTQVIDETSADGADSDVDAVETGEWLEAIDGVLEHDGPGRARHLLTRVVERAQHAGTGPIATLNTPYVNTIPKSLEPPLPGRSRRSSDGCARSCAGTRWRWSSAPTRSPPSSAATSRPTSRWRCSTRSASTTSGTPAPMLTVAISSTSRATRLRGTTRARSSRVGSSAEQLDRFRQEVGGGGLSSYPHPWLMPDFWQFPTRVARDRRDHLDLPGALHEVPERPLDRRHRQPQGVGVPRRRRDGRARVDGRDRARRPRAARQPDLGRQLQPPAARRPRPRQRQDHPGAGVRLPRRRLERDQGDLGLALGSAARAGRRRTARARDDRVRRRRVPDVQVARRRLRARALLRPRSGPAGARRRA